MTSLNFNVFGRRVLIARSGNGWVAYYTGVEGKRRLATDIKLPPDIPEVEIEQWLGDLCHEWASAQNPEVVRLD